MNIRPSAAIRQKLQRHCRYVQEDLGTSFFLTKNGEGDLVVMDIETYNRREKMFETS